MTYAHDDKNLYLAMYAETSTKLDIAGTSLAISQKTGLSERRTGRGLSQPRETCFL